MDNNFVPPDLKHNFSVTTEALLQTVRDQFAEQYDLPYIRLHGDCHAGNVLCQDQLFHIVDLDDCLMGPAVQDIWMMLSGNEQDKKIQLKHILDGYYEFHEFNMHELHLVESLRALRMIHYAGWLAKRWQDPAFPVSFPWFNTPGYWETFLASLREQNDTLAAQC
jgi:Ser/Thr protein kinase RdoA (MazF antagonist)